MTMSVHDACEAWAEGRLPIERALELTGAADVGDLLFLCCNCDVSRPLIEGPDAWRARRAALLARDAALDAGRAHVRVDGPADESGIEAEAVEACRRHAEVIELVRSAPDVPPEPGNDLPEEGPDGTRWPYVQDSAGFLGAAPPLRLRRRRPRRGAWALT